ncbi:ATP-binding cassette domain-containing protein [Terrilactibacillus sp. BCM23-1]|uniref:ATP-binding cassette domain-containing protein n=1 Tax=Terrilactibacillus tamarindi TaxID=2599694 RepID=A0A6N8CRT2_9BACI|nr:ABC transporter ATP-binding protein [Terrilactibacillus tamarindi]MTT32380.1 ATP-binding cassette domain-containing protein [Terrilactibacillus tamarindi]
MTISESILQINDLHTTFYTPKEQLKAIRGINLNVKKGEILGLVGESGSGKSLLMKSVLGILPDSAKIDQGEILLENKHLESLTHKEYQRIRGKDIAMIFQDPMTALNPLKKVGAHIVELLMRIRGFRKKEAKLEAIHLLGQVGIPSPETRVGQYPHEFSGGMRQRVLIAMALASQPKLLIADEPTTALDVTIQAQILRLLKKLQEENGMSVVLITHDLGVVASLCHRIVVMYAGMVMEEGTVQDIFHRPQHPYTQALLDSIPRHENSQKQKLKVIEGTAPSLNKLPKECPFAPRCKKAFERCFQEVPHSRQVSSTQQSACFLSEEVNS